MLKSLCRLLKGVGAFSTNKPEPKERKREKMIIMILLLVILIILVLLLFKCCSHREPPPSDSTNTTTSENKTLDFIPAEGEGNGNITIPGITGIYLKPGVINQTVDFYNPEKNNCLFKISVYLSNDCLLYQSDYIKPGEHLTNINLNVKLEKGIYQNCLLLYECFSLDGKTQYNGSSMKIEINTSK